MKRPGQECTEKTQPCCNAAMREGEREREGARRNDKISTVALWRIYSISIEFGNVRTCAKCCDFHFDEAKSYCIKSGGRQENKRTRVRRKKKRLPDQIESLNVGRKSILILLSMFHSINAHWIIYRVELFKLSGMTNGKRAENEWEEERKDEW